MYQRKYPYSYRQGTNAYSVPLRIRTSETKGCILSLLSLIITAVGFWAIVLLVYFGMKILVLPQWHALLTALGG